MSDELIKCPKCSSTQITANKKGFSAGKAVAGAFLAGGVGLLAGTLGSDKIEVTCLICGNQWAAGEHKKDTPPPPPVNSSAGLIVILVGLAVGLLLMWLLF